MYIDEFYKYKSGYIGLRSFKLTEKNWRQHVGLMLSDASFNLQLLMYNIWNEWFQTSQNTGVNAQYWKQT